jgi:DNA-binding NtrC family response regulator
MNLPRKVLYIDDEIHSEMFSSKLELMREANLDILAVADVDNALHLLREQRDHIGMVVLDMIMPPGKTQSLEETRGGIFTGLETLKAIRSFDQTVPVIIVSYNRASLSDIELSKYNVMEYIEKPVSSMQLVETIKKLLHYT